MKDVTAKEVMQAATSANLTWVPVRECSICQTSIGYEIHDREVFWNGTCDCSSAFGPEARQWQDIADLINMQSQEKHKIALAEKFGLKPDDAE